MKSLETWLAEYGESHQNSINNWIHKVCVPLIVISIYGLLFSIPFPISKSMYYNWGTIVYFIAFIFWFRLSKKIGLIALIFGFILAMSTTYFWVVKLKQLDYLLAKFAAIMFIISWIGQFIGHKFEGKKPSFLDDIKFLLIGPIWVFKKK
jgi:uncharacterized membrane protein YGL010W